VSSHQVVSYISVFDGIDVVWGLFWDVFGGTACNDDDTFICVDGSIVSADGFC
jgi:hypothetical protein